ncbi:RNA polymerase sigma factor [Alteromonas australica]|uniref:RNA polymerase sigma factor n=1 Tax=Alteromonas australica TaxID=589873 RepID=A0A075P4X1_9ALTE|nr:MULTISPECIES: sigma-70 family RNA polymerase sigma factor [Alteromonas]AIF98362.1 RNA polymerase sigma factor [Alteromonas australica]AJP43351.1 RNA polymerase sigma factor [Alteromonas australica]QPL48814.1 sigma-70 family RNA polymerase sigma factor [Alteromonas sp. B31-7]HBF73204.1 RNA polymerase subunit sigma [Alteromonas australica]
MFARNRSEGVQVLSSMNAKQKRYEALVKAFHADIYRYAYWLVKDRSVAEDIVQETFLRAWRSLDALNDEKAAKSWLITILRRENARRFERKQLDVVDIEDVSIHDDTQRADEDIQDRELHRLLGSLTLEYREPLILQLIFGYSGEEIANQLGLNKNTVMTRLFRARNQLRESLENESEQRGRING